MKQPPIEAEAADDDDDEGRTIISWPPIEACACSR